MKRMRAVQFLGLIFILSGVQAADPEFDKRPLLNSTQTRSGFLSNIFNKLVALIKMQISSDIQKFLHDYSSKPAFISISTASNKIVKGNKENRKKSGTNLLLSRLKNPKSENRSTNDENQYLQNSTKLGSFHLSINNDLKQHGNTFFVKVQPLRDLSRKKRSFKISLAKKEDKDEKIEEDLEELINDLEDIKAHRKTTPPDGGDKKSKKKKEKSKGKGGSKKEEENLEFDDEMKSSSKSKTGGKKGKDKEDSPTTTEKDDDDDEETTTKKPPKGKKSKGKEDASTTTEKDDDDDEMTTKKPPKGKKGKGKEDVSTTTDKDDDDDDETTTKKPPKGKNGKGKEDVSTTTEKDDDDDDETTTKKPPKGKKGKGDASTTTENDDDEDEKTTKGENTTTKKPKSGGKPGKKENNEIDIKDIFGSSHSDDASKKSKDKKALDDLVVVGFAIKGNKLQKIPGPKISGKNKWSKDAREVEGNEHPYEEVEDDCDENGFSINSPVGKNGEKKRCKPKQPKAQAKSKASFPNRLSEDSYRSPLINSLSISAKTG